MDDFEMLRGDGGLMKLELQVPSAEAVRWFLNAFHHEELSQGRLSHQASVPEETELLEGLKAILSTTLKEYSVLTHTISTFKGIFQPRSC